MTKNLQALPYIYEIEQYTPGQNTVSNKSVEKIYKLSANENPYGCSPLITSQESIDIKNLQRYPDGNAEKLRKIIAQKHNVSHDKIVCSNGSDEIFTLLCNAYLNKDDEVIYSQYGYLMYRIVTLAAQGKPVEVQAKEYAIDCHQMCKAITGKTKIIFLTNPNNPTGSYITAKTLEAFIKEVPKHIIIVLDEAYAEYVTATDYMTGLELVERHSNVVVTRTFSKIHGLAALRLGWAYANENIIDVLNRIRGPFNVSSVAQSCGILAISDDHFIACARSKNHQWRKTAMTRLQQMGIDVLPSQGNFLLLFFASIQECTRIDEGLKKHGIILRHMSAYKLPHCLRYSCGDEEANEYTLLCLERLMKQG